MPSSIVQDMQQLTAGPALAVPVPVQLKVYEVRTPYCSAVHTLTHPPYKHVEQRQQLPRACKLAARAGKNIVFVTTSPPGHGGLAMLGWVFCSVAQSDAVHFPLRNLAAKAGWRSYSFPHSDSWPGRTHHLNSTSHSIALLN
jgi:hypothetical protein